MLPSKGKTLVKRRRNLHIKRSEFITLMKYIREHYGMKFYVTCMIMFGMGFRVGYAVAVNILDFKDNFTKLSYRDNKSDLVHTDPVPLELQELIKFYVTTNAHTLVGGWLLPNTKNPRKGYTSSSAFHAWFSKVRQNIGKIYPEFLDGEWIETLDKNRKPTGKLKWVYRIGTHSFRRLHRTTFVMEGHKAGISKNDIKFMCHYRSWTAFEVYINEFQILESHDKCVNIAINPMLRQVVRGHQSQTSLIGF